MEVDDCIKPVELEKEVMLDPAELLTMIAHGLETDPEESILPHVSVHAMIGIHDFGTMRVTVSIKGKAVHVLIDTGSTHNFLDLNTGKRLGCALTAISPFVVSVADGNKGVSFDLDMLVLPIGGCNMVLGIQWLITLGDIMWNFRKLKMEFTIMVQKIPLRGIQPPAAKLIQSGKMDKLLAKPTQSEPVELQLVLQKYSDIFEEPSKLPPSRMHDHRIIPKEDTSPVTKRFYRYPTIQKNEIEKTVDEMLASV
ncbi:uncharacterized protein LOC142174252 [Nicotiana tabacum]|uniref:Uncharacterized protein LOC142174252 n=1 Tax=Nicotiana tabacum TaxID=4097 RepID=A0AC58TG10_TOBAC